MRRALLLSFLFLLGQTAAAQDRVEALLREMTLEEKLGQLSQYVPDQKETPPALAKGLIGSILNTGGAAKVNELQRMTLEGSRLKIPLLVGHDVIHGYRTIFPIPLAIAATWDPQLAESSARIAAREARAAGIRWTFAPMVDIARDARWGRIAEGAGEDPFLGASMAAAYVRGFQGTNLASNDSILACAKHYAAYGAAEGGRDYGPVEMTEHTLRHVYLPPFKAAADAGAATFMAGFNSLNGVPAHGNHLLLEQILRREWGFRGFVVSDFAGVSEMIPHGTSATAEDAAIAAIRAGIDMAMWDGSYMQLATAVREGRLPIAIVDDAVRRVLRAKVAVGLFDSPFVDEQRAATTMLTAENRATARRVAQRAIVLLKNDGDLLPLAKKGGTIAVIGPLADAKVEMLGSWAAEGRGEETVSVLEGLRTAAGERIRFARGAGITDGSDADHDAAIELAKQADVVVAVLGEARDMSGEAASRATLDLPGRQQQLLEALVATGKPVVLVVLSGRPLAISWAASHVPAILQGWFLGTEGGNAIADVLFGDVNPSAKLPVTMPRTTGQVPIYYSHLPTGRPADPKNKYTSKYFDIAIGPLYPFGHGLSYTRFEYANLKVDGLRIAADIRNSGSRAGDEIVQLYIRDKVASVARPVRELKGFQRVTLQPGETRRVAFTLAKEDLAIWTNNQWRVEPGDFDVWIAPDAASGLQGTVAIRE